MLPEELLPTRLITPAERPTVPIEPVRKPSRLRPLYVFSRFFLLFFKTALRHVTGRLTPQNLAGLVRQFLEDAGLVWVKGGQLLGMRSDLLPVKFTEELAKLSDQSAGFPFDDVRKIIEKELQASLERYFDEFEQRPFVTTTGFQLHRAHLRREQVWVVVKVQRPYCEETAARDLVLIRRVTRLLKYFKVFPKMRWGDLLREIDELTHRELDFRYEATWLSQLHATLPRHGIYVPEVFKDYSTRRVLVMEFIHATLLADYINLSQSDPQRLACWLEENNIHPRKVARRLFHSVWRQIFEDNLFHADMKPYNVILLRNSRLAIIDCRNVGILEAENLAKHRAFVESVAWAEYATAAEHSFLLAIHLPLVDLGEVKTEMIRVLRHWENRNYVRGLPAEEKSLTSMLNEMTRVMYRYGFEVHWGMATLAWAMINADRSILQLASDVNYLLWLRRYFQKAEKRASRINIEQAIDRLSMTLASLRDLPKTLSDTTIAQQTILRRQARVIHGSASKAGYVLATVIEFLTFALLLLGLFAFAAFLMQHHPEGIDPAWLGPQLSTWLQSMPRLPYWIWLVLLGVLLLMTRFLLVTRKQYLQKQIQWPEARSTPTEPL